MLWIELRQAAILELTEAQVYSSSSSLATAASSAVGGMASWSAGAQFARIPLLLKRFARYRYLRAVLGSDSSQSSGGTPKSGMVIRSPSRLADSCATMPGAL